MRMRLAALLLLSLPLHAAEAPKGSLVLVGGGKRPDPVMRKFVELAGGPKASILIVPTASELPDTGAFYVKELGEKLGCSNVTPLEIHGRADADRQANVELVEKAGGIFFAGGDQRRITRALAGSKVLEAIVAAHRRGAAIFGTSAGLACMSPLMLTGDGEFTTIRAKNVELWPGLGLFPGAVLDQHFVARSRENRLLSVILEHPDLLGIGVDEATAVWLKPDGTFEVLGEGWVMVIDAAATKVTRRAGPKDAIHLGAKNLRVHLLQPGDAYDLATRSPLLAAERVPTSAAAPSQ